MTTAHLHPHHKHGHKIAPSTHDEKGKNDLFLPGIVTNHPNRRFKSLKNTLRSLPKEGQTKRFETVSFALRQNEDFFRCIKTHKVK